MKKRDKTFYQGIVSENQLLNNKTFFLGFTQGKNPKGVLGGTETLASRAFLPPKTQFFAWITPLLNRLTLGSVREWLSAANSLRIVIPRIVIPRPKVRAEESVLHQCHNRFLAEPALSGAKGGAGGFGTTCIGFVRRTCSCYRTEPDSNPSFSTADERGWRQISFPTVAVSALICVHPQFTIRDKGVLKG